MENKNKLSKIANKVVDVVLILTVLVLASAIGMMVFMNKNPEDAYLFGLKPVYVATDSMEPTMMEGALCLVKKADYEDIEVDDIIMSKIDDKIISHRVVSITPEGIRTKGDNSELEDAYLLQEENVKGKVVFTWNYFRVIADDFKSPAGIAKWVGILLFVNIVIFVVPAIVRKRRGDE